MVNYRYLGRLGDFKNNMPNKKTNHNHEEDLGCVPGLLFKWYHKTLKLVQIVYHTICTLSEIIEQMKHIYQDTQALSNIDIVHNDNHIHKI